MKKLIRFLILSLSLLSLTYVFLIYASSNNATNYLNLLKSTFSTTVDTVQDSVQKITSSTISASITDDIANLKANLVISSGTGNLVADDSISGQGSTQVDATKAVPATPSYNFSQEMYPFRAMLTQNQQIVYDTAYNNAMNLNPTFKVDVPLDKQGLNNVMEAVFNDHPELFWIDTSYSFGYSSKGTVVSITLQYNDTVNNFQVNQNKFNNAANAIISKASNYSSDLDKEKYVYKTLMNTVSYDENSLLNQSAYSALVNGSSVCAGYSRAFQYIMLKLGIPCYLCTGYANNGNHAWNIIKIDGSFHNVDLSWDDSIGDAKNSYSYEYFNISDKVISSNHIRRDLSVNLPTCK